jgi:hypothetical protein
LARCCHYPEAHEPFQNGCPRLGDKRCSYRRSLPLYCPVPGDKKIEPCRCGGTSPKCPGDNSRRLLNLAGEHFLKPGPVKFGSVKSVRASPAWRRGKRTRTPPQQLRRPRCAISWPILPPDRFYCFCRAVWGGRPRPQTGPLAGLIARPAWTPRGRVQVRGPAPPQLQF